MFHDSSHDLGIDPGLQKDGVEAHLQALLAEHPEALAPGLSLVRREHPTPIGPVDLLCRDAAGRTWRSRSNVEEIFNQQTQTKPTQALTGQEDSRSRRATYGRSGLRTATCLTPVGGILGSQTIKPQARTLARPRSGVRGRGPLRRPWIPGDSHAVLAAHIHNW